MTWKLLGILILVILALPTRYLVFVDQVYGREGFEYMPTALLNWRVGVLGDYEVSGSYDILSYYTYKMNALEVHDSNRMLYLIEYKKLIELIDFDNFSQTTLNKLMIESAHKGKLDTFTELYCNANRLDFTDIKFNYEPNIPTHLSEYISSSKVDRLTC
ncbi:hypothetical protein [Thalassotalea euphylliae]|uniref:Uncharacterized protein n=1 Tax=Thalassotalea euphylliae TaxID=1655234 RepID=A0A3E0UGZ5_9GAMM|nr:hypothetical protein [Thalassotalea euphylliae]REL36321.1 hypothetical protein DXX92_13910 [Thalassotalea euphylliae]